MGPVLIRQDLAEASSNVAKRMEFISKELERLDSVQKNLEQRMQEKQKDIIKIQKKLQGE